MYRSFGDLGCPAEVANAIRNHHDVMRHWDALLPGRVLHVPYEQLVEDQEGWSRRLLQHCGLPWDDSVLEFHKTERDVQTASLSQARGCSPGPFAMRWEHAFQGPRPAVARVCPGCFRDRQPD